MIFINLNQYLFFLFMQYFNLYFNLSDIKVIIYGSRKFLFTFHMFIFDLVYPVLLIFFVLNFLIKPFLIIYIFMIILQFFFNINLVNRLFVYL